MSDLKNEIRSYTRSIGSKSTKEAQERTLLEKFVGIDPLASVDDVPMIEKVEGVNTIRWGAITRGYGGVLNLPSYTNNGDGTVTIGSGTYVLNSLSDGSGNYASYVIAGNTFTLTDGIQNYIIADFNGGTPILLKSTNLADINDTSSQVVFTLTREGNYIGILDWDEQAKSLPNKLERRLRRTERFSVEPGGLMIGEVATRRVTITSGTIWYGATSLITPDSDSGDGLTKTKLYVYNGSTWSSSLITQYNNTQYQGGSGLVALTANRYAVSWVYKGIETDKDQYILMGVGDYTLLQAQASQPPALRPALINSHAILVGRIIIQKGDSTAVQIDSAFNVAFNGSGLTDHSMLSNLAWLNSKHTGTANKRPVFSALGAAAEKDDTIISLVDMPAAYPDLVERGFSIKTITPSGDKKIDWSTKYGEDSTGHWVKSLRMVDASFNSLYTMPAAAPTADNQALVGNADFSTRWQTLSSLYLSDVIGLTNNYIPVKTALGLVDSVINQQGKLVGINRVGRAAIDVYNDATGVVDLPGGLSSKTTALILSSNASVADSRPGIVQYVYRTTAGGIASSVLTTYVGYDDASVWRAGTVGVYTGDVASSANGRYLYIDARTDGAYDNATLKIDQQNRVGVNIPTTSRPLYRLDVRNSSVGGTIAGFGYSENRGLYVSALSVGTVYQHSNSTHDGSNFTALFTSASIITMAAGFIAFRGSTGLTAGSTFTPTEWGRFDVNGVTAIGAKFTGSAVVGRAWICTNVDGSGAWTAINQMVYPNAGIAVSTGSAWGTSITDNSSNWNTAYGWGNWASNFGTTTGKIAQGDDSRIVNGQTAYGWGNHASAGYLSISTPSNGDILYYNSGWQKLTKGTDGKVLSLVGGLPAWSTFEGSQWITDPNGYGIKYLQKNVLIGYNGDSVPSAARLYVDGTTIIRNGAGQQFQINGNNGETTYFNVLYSQLSLLFTRSTYYIWCEQGTGGGTFYAKTNGDVYGTGFGRFDGGIGSNGRTSINTDGTISPVTLADASAANNSIYYSSTQSKLVYKDSGGTVNVLY